MAVSPGLKWRETIVLKEHSYSLPVKSEMCPVACSPPSLAYGDGTVVMSGRLAARQ